jgi:CO dehydrogenase maturation factor
MNSVVILDMEAGVEHLGRGTTKGIDIMIIVVEPGARSIETAGRIKELGQEIDIEKFAAIINKAGEDVKNIEKMLGKYGIPVIGVIHYDMDLVKADIESIAPIEIGGPLMESIENIWENISKQE